MAASEQSRPAGGPTLSLSLASVLLVLAPAASAEGVQSRGWLHWHLVPLPSLEYVNLQPAHERAEIFHELS